MSSIEQRTLKRIAYLPLATEKFLKFLTEESYLKEFKRRDKMIRGCKIAFFRKDQYKARYMIAPLFSLTTKD